MTSEVMNTTAKTTTIVGEGALSIKNERYTPAIEVSIETITAARSAKLKFLVSNTTTAPGVISNDTDKTTPTAFSVSTMVSDIKHSRL